MIGNGNIDSSVGYVCIIQLNVTVVYLFDFDNVVAHKFAREKFYGFF